MVPKFGPNFELCPGSQFGILMLFPLSAGLSVQERPHGTRLMVRDSLHVRKGFWYATILKGQNCLPVRSATEARLVNTLTSTSLASRSRVIFALGKYNQQCGVVENERV